MVGVLRENYEAINNWVIFDVPIILDQLGPINCQKSARFLPTISDKIGSFSRNRVWNWCAPFGHIVPRRARNRLEIGRIFANNCWQKSAVGHGRAFGSRSGAGGAFDDCQQWQEGYRPRLDSVGLLQPLTQSEMGFTAPLFTPCAPYPPNDNDQMPVCECCHHRSNVCYLCMSSASWSAPLC